MTHRFNFRNGRGELPGASDFVFSALGPASFDAPSGDGLRRFSGTAYTGALIVGHPYWGNVIFDLSSVSLPAKMPILLNHDGGAIVGYSDENRVTVEEGIALGGFLSKATAEGVRVAALSDEGFPWQMSVRIEPTSIEEVLPGSAITVNNRQVNGPAVVFKNSAVLETSFTPTGWDSATSAIALSHTSNPTQEEDSMSKELEEKVARLEGELSASNEMVGALTQENADFKASAEKLASAARMSRVSAVLDALGKTYTPEDLERYSSLPDEAVELLASAAPKKEEQKLPQTLFAHQATEPPKGAEAATNTLGAQLLAACDKKSDEHKKKK